MLIAIRASVELKITDFVTIDKITKVIFIYLKKSLSSSSSVTISLHFCGLMRKNIGKEKKNIFHQYSFDEKLIAYKKNRFPPQRKNYVIKKYLIMKEKKITEKNYLSE